MTPWALWTDSCGREVLTQSSILPHDSRHNEAHVSRKETVGPFPTFSDSLDSRAGTRGRGLLWLPLSPESTQRPKYCLLPDDAVINLPALPGYFYRGVSYFPPLNGYHCLLRLEVRPRLRCFLGRHGSTTPHRATRRHYRLCLPDRAFRMLP